jgi:tetraacyldisaccharide 4'-kinase
VSLNELWYPDDKESWPRRLALAPLTAASWLFGGAVSLRSLFYESEALTPTRVEGAQVISVGNLNVGGAGKTPAVIFLAQRAALARKRVAVLSRGYGRPSRDVFAFQGPDAAPVTKTGDEPRLIAARCPQARVWVGARRAALALRARREDEAEVILLDDGLQHRALHRDVELVVVDEAIGFGNGELMPRGPLREPLSALERADLIWLRASAGRPAPLPAFECPVVRVRYFPAAAIDPSGAPHDCASLRGHRAIAVAGLARPEGFFRTLESLGLNLSQRLSFPDHHNLTAAELERVASIAKEQSALVVTTEKDAQRMPGCAVWQLRMETEIQEGEQHLAQALGW